MSTGSFCARFVSLVCRTYSSCPVLATLTSLALWVTFDAHATLEPIVRSALLARNLIVGNLSASKRHFSIHCSLVTGKARTRKIGQDH
jgi:hypothetical protein